MICIVVMVILFVISFIVYVFEEVKGKVDFVKGKIIVEIICVVCYGVDGNSFVFVNLYLVGQIQEYFYK